jgi:superoxide dismutase
MRKSFYITLLTATLFSCKKDTLVEVVDVPSTPIVAPKQEKGKPSDVKAIEGVFVMPKLNYEYNALEPYFDPLTMEFHYSKHHLGYVNALNKAVIKTKYEVLDLDQILKNLNLTDTEVRNDAGGNYNHKFFFDELAANAGGEPEGELLESINRDFGSFEEFRNQFVETSLKIPGSGWTWLVSDKSGKLKIVTSSNNDNPLMKNLGISGIPLLNLDMWEHAYYLKFQNRKREYANTFFSVVNWKKIQERYEFPKVAIAVSKPATTTETIEVPVPEKNGNDEFNM